MNNLVLLNLVTVVMAGLTAVGCAPKADNSQNEGNQVMDLSKAASEATLISRYNGGTYASASYSFRFSSQDEQVTRNEVEILFEGRQDFSADYFQVDTVTDDNSFIYDLGEKSCKDIKPNPVVDETPEQTAASGAQQRKAEPMRWLMSSDADPSELTPAKKANVSLNHCYLVYSNDSEGRVVALFHVKDHEKSKKVQLNEIEVLEIRNF